MRMSEFLLLLSLVAAAAAAALSLELQLYRHAAVLDGQSKYSVHWKYQEKTITFLLQVETMGYVGFGFSPTGAMASSDIVIGGVERGKPYLQDYFTDADRVLHRDSQQNYNLEYAMENGTHTILKFSRDLHTCDPNDKTITESTVRVIWAYHADDFGSTGPTYHGSNRGRKSLRLLNPEKTNLISIDTAYFNFTNLAVPIPYKDTIYWCQMFKMPTLKKKHHIIKVEPLIQKGHENLVHHILLYECDRNVNDTVLDYGHECYHPNMPDVFLTCETVLFAWAIGGEALTNEKPSGIHVFAVLLHAHLAGTAIWARHFRKGEEQKLLAYDNEFDFNFQEFQYLKDERTILPGDNLITECQYSTKGRTMMTWGGLSTRDEMCLSYLLYYPRINLARCETIPEVMEQLQFIGVKEIYKPITSWPFIIKSPKRYNNLSFTDAMNTFQWSRRKGLSFNEHVRQIPMNVRCSKHESDEWSVQGMIVSPPEVKKTYKSEEFVCESASSCLTCNIFICLLIIFCNALNAIRDMFLLHNGYTFS
ncbi:DBH-like monooxygenase protein 1 isoform X2 [Ascaphus truei]|uniref:DBH-like monooxygenase protein 1 isoform X2 n=1 Tax=Ascaphus truei TaxID=8439 RepID=UPI003F59B317